MKQSVLASKYDNQEPLKNSVRQVHLQQKWQFKPRSLWPFLAWGFILFLGARILVFPLAEAVYGYVVKTQELNDLKSLYASTQLKVAKMSKTRDFMKTPAYIEERGHQIGLIKSNESKMVVVDSPNGTDVKKRLGKKVEIGD